MDAAEVSKELAIPISTVYRLIKILLKHQLVEQDPERRGYRLGVRSFKMGMVYRFQRRITDIAHPFLVNLRNATDETVCLAVRERQGILILREIEGFHELRITHDEGRTMTLFAGATGKILLAHMSADEQDQIIAKGLFKKTPNTITDPILLKRQMEEIRTAGYAYSDQEWLLGVRAIAAPVRDFSGKVVAGISIVGPVHRFQEEDVTRFIPMVQKSADQISKTMGYGII